MTKITKYNRHYIVTSREGHGKIVFLLDENDLQIPKTPKGYKKIRGDKPKLSSYVTDNQLERLKYFYDKVIDLRDKH